MSGAGAPAAVAVAPWGILMCLVAAAGPVAAEPPAAGSRTPAGAALLREERTVTVSGRPEKWRIEWGSPPREECGPEEGDWFTCPCAGFAFGEAGPLDLVRARPGRPEERLALGPLFADLSGGDPPAGGTGAVLRRWPVEEGDLKAADSPSFPALVRSRPTATAMRFSDYDRDGRATEFVLQVGNAPCGKRLGVVVGISRESPRLHAFGSAANPGRPLVLRVDHWGALLRSRPGAPVTVLDWRCGDHASEEETELVLSAEAGRIRALRRTYDCGPDGAGGRGALTGEEVM